MVQSLLHWWGGALGWGGGACQGDRAQGTASTSERLRKNVPGPFEFKGLIYKLKLCTPDHTPHVLNFTINYFDVGL